MAANIIVAIIVVALVWAILRKISRRLRGERFKRRIMRLPPTNQRRGNHITQRNDSGHIRRAREYGVPWERIDLVTVFNRDRWICQLCGGPIDPDRVHPDPGMPSLDHVTPLSLGGPHSYWNVQASHLRCNLSKGDRI